MTSVRITHIEHQRRRPRPFLDLAGFFLFFGISGVDQGRDARMRRRFEAETFTHRVTAHVTPALAPGRYLLEGLPDAAVRRTWVVERAGRAVATLSDEGWAAFQAWQQGGGRGARAVPVADA